MMDYFRSTPDPERGWALAALTGALTFPHAKPGLIRSLIAERTDAVLFELSYDYVGDLSETIALMWPAPDLSSPARGRSEPGRVSPAAFEHRQSSLVPGPRRLRPRSPLRQGVHSRARADAPGPDAAEKRSGRRSSRSLSPP